MFNVRRELITCALSPVVLVGAVLEAGLEAVLPRPLHDPRGRHDGLSELPQVAHAVPLHGAEAVVLVVVGVLAPRAAVADDAAPGPAPEGRGELRFRGKGFAAVLTLSLQTLSRHLRRSMVLHCCILNAVFRSNMQIQYKPLVALQFLQEENNLLRLL